ncbi:MAG: hypothetical protein IPF98_04475 [Gemmatimonadetes bacterium]|nr:hypothetical protein [Gemmatimonadota bacterium]
MIEFKEGIFRDEKPLRRGALAWRPTPEADLEEVLFFDRESPHRKYGAGLLHPRSSDEFLTPDQQAVLAADNVGVDSASPDSDDDETAEDEEEKADVIADLPSSRAEGSEHDFDVTSPDMRRPSSMAISVCLHLPSDGSLVVRLPRFRRFQWQQSSDRPFAVNGRYEQAGRIVMLDGFARPAVPLWRRTPAVGPETEVRFSGQLLRTLSPQKESVAGASSAGPRLRVDVFARELPRQPDHYIVTVVLRNEKATKTRKESEDATLFQTYFEVLVEGGSILPYPESHRPFDHLDAEEQSLALLYRDSATWAIGHGCAAGWDEAPGVDPTVVYADVFPAFETPSMTPDVTDRSGDVIALRMRDLSTLPDDGTGVIWDALESLVSEYDTWVQARRSEAESLADRFTEVADRHLAQCEESLSRIRGGLQLLRTDADVRAAFRLANLSMLLQQIATKHLRKRSIDWDRNRQCAGPSTIGDSPWNVFARSNEGSAIGRWRAFQLAFLLLQLEGIARPDSPDREIIDLIWFPTGGGKTEAYLAVMAFLMWHQRLLMGRETDGPLRDGTNVLMRYTLRMLTTQQFQRAASLICAMEYLRRHPTSHADVSRCTGQRFSLGLWIGGDGTPNNNARAKQALADYKSDKVRGNPLVLTECPWCRTEIGRCRKGRASQWQLAGIAETSEGPRLYCVDGSCEFGREKPSTWLPVEVIDERIYASAPSLVIGTADKFAMLAYRPEAGVIFGRRFEHGEAVQVHQPPSLVVQDELHLIAGPLGTLYGLYESVIERLCTSGEGASRIVPKIISSTATIRGAEDQTLALYARIAPKTGKSNVRLFPSPGLQMGDSFFGVYARLPGGALDSGRLYLGIHASNYGSILTAQVRLYSAALCRPAAFAPEARDPWWTLLAFYNSIRELGGAKTLLDSDIRARLKFLQNRESVPDAARRKLVVTGGAHEPTRRARSST